MELCVILDYKPVVFRTNYAKPMMEKTNKSKLLITLPKFEIILTYANNSYQKYKRVK